MKRLRILFRFYVGVSIVDGTLRRFGASQQITVEVGRGSVVSRRLSVFCCNMATLEGSRRVRPVHQGVEGGSIVSAVRCGVSSIRAGVSYLGVGQDLVDLSFFDHPVSLVEVSSVVAGVRLTGRLRRQRFAVVHLAFSRFYLPLTLAQRAVGFRRTIVWSLRLGVSVITRMTVVFAQHPSVKTVSGRRCGARSSAL